MRGVVVAAILAGIVAGCGGRPSGSSPSGRERILPPLLPIVTPYGSHDAGSPHRLTVSRIESLVRAKGLRDLDGLLAALAAEPEQAPLLRSFTLMYGSQSLFRADITPLHPRVIFHKDGLFAAVNGDPTKDSYRFLEAIEFTTAEREFDFYLVEFPPPGSSLPVKFERNPESCTACHGRALRPLWGAYPLWPGAFGSVNDAFTPTEEAHFASFASRLAAPGMRRYRHFMTRAEDFAVNVANIGLGVHLSYLNYNRMQTRLLNSPAYRPYRFALLGASLGCEHIGTFLPPALRARHEARLGADFAGVNASTIARIDHEAGLRVARFQELQTLAPVAYGVEDAGFHDRFSVQRTASFRYVLEGQPIDPALDFRYWSLSYAPGDYSYNFSNGASGFRDFLDRELKPALVREHPELATLRTDQMWYFMEKECGELRARSLQNLSAF